MNLKKIKILILSILLFSLINTSILAEQDNGGNLGNINDSNNLSVSIEDKDISLDIVDNNNDSINDNKNDHDNNIDNSNNNTIEKYHNIFSNELKEWKKIRKEWHKNKIIKRIDSFNEDISNISREYCDINFCWKENRENFTIEDKKINKKSTISKNTEDQEKMEIFIDKIGEWFYELGGKYSFFKKDDNEIWNLSEYGKDIKYKNNYGEWLLFNYGEKISFTSNTDEYESWESENFGEDTVWVR